MVDTSREPVKDERGSNNKSELDADDTTITEILILFLVIGGVLVSCCCCLLAKCVADKNNNTSNNSDTRHPQDIKLLDNERYNYNDAQERISWHNYENMNHYRHRASRPRVWNFGRKAYNDRIFFGGRFSTRSEESYIYNNPRYRT
eukprot:UN01527